MQTISIGGTAGAISYSVTFKPVAGQTRTAGGGLNPAVWSGENPLSSSRFGAFRLEHKVKQATAPTDRDSVEYRLVLPIKTGSDANGDVFKTVTANLRLSCDSGLTSAQRLLAAKVVDDILHGTTINIQDAVSTLGTPI